MFSGRATQWHIVVGCLSMLAEVESSRWWTWTASTFDQIQPFALSKDRPTYREWNSPPGVRTFLHTLLQAVDSFQFDTVYSGYAECDGPTRCVSDTEQSYQPHIVVSLSEITRASHWRTPLAFVYFGLGFETLRWWWIDRYLSNASTQLNVNKI